MGSDDLKQLYSRCPSLLLQDVATHIAPRVQALMHHGFSQEQVGMDFYKVFKPQRSMLLRTLQAKSVAQLVAQM